MTKRIWRSVVVHFHFYLAIYLLFSCGIGCALAGASEPEVANVSAAPLHGSGMQGVLRVLIEVQLNAAPTATGNIGSTIVGQSSTLLPDGQLLLIGGQQNGQPVSAAYFEDPVLKTIVPLSNGLHFARYCHSATLLPNGTVLILGGLGADGKVVETNEIFDPSTLQFTVIATPNLTPRAFHTATLLTDGRVLIAGGVTASGQMTATLELWDSKTGSVTPSPVELQIPRGADTATLESNGTVQLWGGIDANGNTLTSGEVYNPATGEISTESSPLPPSTIEPPTMAASVPTDGAANVALNATIALRFSKALQVQSVNDKTITLDGPNGAVLAKIVPAEGGMLAFVTPEDSLVPATDYELSIHDATDPPGSRVPDTVVRFTTASNSDAAGEPAGAALPLATPNPFDSPSRKLPPLQAPKGITAVSGQVLQLNGDPLPNTTLQIGSLSVQSDKTGRFLLKNVPSGHQVMWIVGTTANSNGQSYGIFEDGVDVTASQTNVLSYTIWMTPLDTADEVTIPSPTTAETVVSTPVLPGLELHIPAGLVIKDWYGNTVTKVGITLISTSQPPFPLPAGVNVPTYFTIQPGGAYFEVPGQNSGWTAGAQLYYPNVENLPPNAVDDFWNYDPTGKGWYVYGQGHVTADKKEIIPNPGVEIYGFTGAMVGGPPYPPNGPKGGGNGGGSGGGGGGNGGDPVDLQTGLFVYTKTDLALSDVIPINVTRTYRQMDPNVHAFGVGTTSNYDIFLIGDGQNYTWMDLVLANGGLVQFTNVNGNNSYTNCELVETSTPGTYFGAEILWNGSGWTMTLKNGTRLLFPESSGDNNSDLEAALTGIVDRYGNAVTLTRDSNHNVTEVTSPNGRWIQYTYETYNSSYVVSQATDSIGRTVYYTYDAGGRLQTVKDANGGTTTFGYDSNNDMTTIEDPQNIVYLTNYYDSNDMVKEQDLADGSGYDIYKFSYVQNTSPFASSLTNSQTTVTDPNGNVRVVNFNTDGYITSETYGYGTSQAETITYDRQPYSGEVLSTTDALNRTTAYTYDSAGDVTNTVAMAGTPEATATSIAYNRFGEVTSVTNALGQTTALDYDSNGNLVNSAGSDGNASLFTYNPAGQPVTATDPLGNTSQLSYSGPDIVGVTDPLSRQTSRFVDEAGRPGGVTNSGLSVQTAFNPLNEVTSVTDSLGGVTSMQYDNNGNLTQLTDALNTQNPTKFTYYNTDRLQSRTDPLGKSDSFQYDGDGNVTQYTDRNGNITTYQYDALNRLTFVGYGTQPGPTYQSTISYTYDLGNRLTQVVDSITGTTTVGYDDFNRATSVTSPQGSVSYTYDAIGRRQTMTVAGQPEVVYTYDSGNRVTQIVQGSSTVQIGYDTDGRRTSLTLPNGIVANYAYDVASQLTGITYTQSGTDIGDLDYTYDSGGRVATVTGSLAHINLPQPVSGLAYNADNRLTGFGGSQLTYDNNGNLTGDGAHTYTWDARNHLVSIDGGSTASFVYGPFGRRVSKTVYGVTTGYLYDGSNVVQELSGSTPSANLLSGGQDEVFTRTDSSGVADFIRNGIGSTAELTDSTGAALQSYTYDPYGFTSTNGGSANSYQYIGRETDATGLYYFRNRYYNPITERFLSEDPTGLVGGPNLYEYGADNPATFRDPNGKFVEGCLIGVAGYEFGQMMQGLSGRKMDSGWNEAKGAAAACAIGFFTEGIGEWAEAFAGGTGAIADGLEGLGPDAMDAEQNALAAQNPCGMCFPAGTPVETKHGRIPIEKIKVGDEVLARNMATGKLEYKKVVALTRPHQDHLLELKILGQHAAIEPTPSHPFWVKRAGKTAWITAGKMHTGDLVLTEKGKWEKVTEDVPLNRLATVYNFEVQDDHDYFIGSSGILVHNGTCDFLVTPNGDVIPVPEGATGPTPTYNGKGIQFNGGSGGNGLAPNVTDVRVMDPTSYAPNGYANYGAAQTNGGWQSVNPYTGQSVGTADPWWHIQLQ